MKVYYCPLIGNSMNILAIIQARVGSTRLPGKVILKVGKKTIIEHVYSRVKKAKLINDIFVATSINIENLPLIKICSDNNIRIFIGSENDVLDRFYQLTKLIRPNHIVRITADCPMIDPEIIDLVIKEHLKSNADYSSNAINQSFPDGLDVEVFKFETLQKTWKEAKLKSEREHVTAFIYNNKNIFKIHSIDSNINYGNYRWTVDNKEDLIFFQTIYENLNKKNPFFGFQTILDFIEKNPSVKYINKDINRNEGYKKSLDNDEFVEFKE